MQKSTGLATREIAITGNAPKPTGTWWHRSPVPG